MVCAFFFPFIAVVVVIVVLGSKNAHPTTEAYINRTLLVSRVIYKLFCRCVVRFKFNHGPSACRTVWRTRRFRFLHTQTQRQRQKLFTSMLPFLTFNQHRPADKEVCNWSPLHWAVTAEGKARLAVDVLRVANIRAVIAFINRHIYPGSFRMRLGEIKGLHHYKQFYQTWTVFKLLWKWSFRTLIFSNLF